MNKFQSEHCKLKSVGLAWGPKLFSSQVTGIGQVIIVQWKLSTVQRNPIATFNPFDFSTTACPCSTPNPLFDEYNKQATGHKAASTSIRRGFFFVPPCPLSPSSQLVESSTHTHPTDQPWSKTSALPCFLPGTIMSLTFLFPGISDWR